MLDYRYARYIRDADYRLDPFIRRGFWRDVQVWLPALDYKLNADGAPERQSTSVTVVIKTSPLISWLWLGLLLALAGGVMMTLFAWRSSTLSTLK
jgi:cytochrome c-type biogenesis protein CcmF